MYNLIGALNPTMQQPFTMPGASGTPWQQLQATRGQTPAASQATPFSSLQNMTGGAPWQNMMNQLAPAQKQQFQGLLGLLQARQTSPGFYHDMGPGSLYYQPWMNLQQQIQQAPAQAQAQAQAQQAKLSQALEQAQRQLGPRLANPQGVMTAIRQPTGAGKLAAAAQLWPNLAYNTY